MTLSRRGFLRAASGALAVLPIAPLASMPSVFPIPLNTWVFVSFGWANGRMHFLVNGEPIPVGSFIGPHPDDAHFEGKIQIVTTNHDELSSPVQLARRLGYFVTEMARLDCKEAYTVIRRENQKDVIGARFSLVNIWLGAR